MTLIWLIGGSGTSIVTAFLYRYLALTDRLHSLHQRKSLACVALIHLIGAFPVIYASFETASSDRAEVFIELKEVCSININTFHKTIKSLSTTPPFTHTIKTTLVFNLPGGTTQNRLVNKCTVYAIKSIILVICSLDISCCGTLTWCHYKCTHYLQACTIYK